MPNDDKNIDDSVQSWINPVLSSESEDQDDVIIQNLRPTAFNDYIGQEKVKENLRIACQAAKKRGESVDHLLFYGPAGLGKTSLARIISKEMGVGFKGTSGPIIERPGDLAAMLTSLDVNDVLFIDEIHRLPRIIEEVLYSAMEDFEIDILIGQGPAAKSVKVPLKPFTLVGATTRSGMLTSPLRDRFGITARLDYYKNEDLQKIIIRSADLLGVSISEDAALEIGARSRGTPRIANKLLKRVRDYAEEKANGTIDLKVVDGALNLLDIDSLGLTSMDRKMLKIIIEQFNAGPVGIETIAAALGEEKETVEDVYEPYLIQKGFIARTRRGREATKEAANHLNIEFNKSENLKLF